VSESISGEAMRAAIVIVAAHAGIGRVLDGVEGRPAIGQHPAKFAVEVVVLRREPSNGLGDGRVFLCPVVAPTRQDLRFARIEPGVHPIPIELEFVKPVGAVRGFLNELGKLRFDPGRWGS
jgi:hypothetical protein